ncbi:MAG: Fpg/Nei family DNA glycosylase [Solirubrobacterales bacterium]
MPELPEVEIARRTLAEGALHRTIVAVDDSDDWVCRPHEPGEIAGALTGRQFTEAHRCGKSMWVHSGGATLGLHLGMSGRIVIDAEPAPNSWDRFAVEFEGGGRMALFDKRRLGRAVLDPDHDDLGPDAAEVDRDTFRERVGRGETPIKARLLDQSTVAGIGNLLADEVLFRTSIDPRREAETLDTTELDALRRATRAAVRSALDEGGVHTLAFVIASRDGDGSCPRCEGELERAKVGGRTTWWCPHDQG